MKRDRDHPSIVAWVPVNESFGLQDVDDETRARFLLDLYALTHRLDGTGPVHIQRRLAARPVRPLHPS